MPSVVWLVAVLLLALGSLTRGRAQGVPPTSFSIRNVAHPPVLSRVYDLVAMDFNSDGNLDLVLSQLWTPPTVPGTSVPMVALRNTGGGNFQDATAEVLGGLTTVHQRDFRVADFDGDGRMDLFVADHGTDTAPFPGGQSRVLMQTQDGRLRDVTGTAIPIVSMTTHHSTTGDIDGDGDEDIYLSNIYNNTGEGPRFYVNDGKGMFTADATRLPAEVRSMQNRYTASLLVDIDGDGDLDLVLGGHAGTEDHDRILLNDGTGHFSYAPVSALPARALGLRADTLSIVSADFDGDGWPDLLVSTELDYLTPRLQLFLNNRDGTFRDATAGVPQDWPARGPFGLNWVPWIRVADFNGDGKPDFACFLQNGRVYLFLNQGGAVFTEVGLNYGFPTSAVASIVTGDFNGDGNPDLFVLSYLGTSVLALNAGPAQRHGYSPSKSSQAIIFPTLKQPLFTGDAPPSLTATSSSGLPVSFTVVSGPGVIAGGTLVPSSPGRVVVRAIQSGDDRFNAADPVERTVLVRDGSPTISEGPRDSVVDHGWAVSLKVRAVGGGLLSYQWFRNGVPVPGANTPELILPSGLPDRDGEYTVLVSNAAGQIRSGPAMVHVLPEGYVPWSLLRQVYRNLPGNEVAQLLQAPIYPFLPDETDTVPYVESRGLGTRYGERLSGIITAPVSGDYVFYIASDDQSELYLSTDSRPENRVKIAWEPSRNPPRSWTQGNGRNASAPENRSRPITLKGGQDYFIEVLHKQGESEDHVAVAWQIPGREAPKDGGSPIPGNYLSHPPYDPMTQPPVFTVMPVPGQTEVGGNFSFQAVAVSRSPLNLQWTFRGVPVTGATNATLVLQGVTAAMAGFYQVTAQNQYGAVSSAPTELKVVQTVYVPGGLQRAVFLNMLGTAVRDMVTAPVFPSHPDTVDVITNLESVLTGDSLGERLWGVLTPPTTGTYRFYISGDDQSELWLGTDESPASMARIAVEPQWNNSRTWTGSDRRDPVAPENRSGFIPLNAGQHYAIEVLHKQGAGGVHVEVAWQPPGKPVPANGTDPISGDFLAYPRVYASTDLPEILRPPTDRFVAAGVDVTLSVAAAGFGPLAYQWYYNGVPIGSAVSSTLPLGPATADQTGSYVVAVGGPAGTVMSKPALVQVTRQVQRITFAPPGTIYAGSVGSQLSASASSGLPVRFEVVSGPGVVEEGVLKGTGVGVILVRAIQDGDGRYAPAAGVEWSVESLDPRIQIKSQPVSLTVAPGALGKFEVIATGGAPLSFQWFKGSDPIPGASNPFLIFPAAGVGDSGDYSVRVGNSGGSVSSEVVHLTVDPQVLIPGQLRRELYRNITGTSVSALTRNASYLRSPTQVDNVNMFESANVGINVGVRLTGFLTPQVSGDYVFFLASDDQGELWLSTDASPWNRRRIAFEPSYAAYRDYASTLNRNATNPENRSGPITLQAGQLYYVELLQKQGFGGDTVSVAWQVPGGGIPAQGSDPITSRFLAQRELAPWIVTGPSSLKRAAGSLALMSVQADGSAPLRFQWAHDGVPIEGATNANFTIASVTPSDAGLYSVRVDNDAGFTNSPPAILTFARKDQTVSFPQPADPLSGRGSVALNATASSGLAVVYDVVSGPGEMTSAGLRATNTGPVVIRASQPGNDLFAPANPVERTVQARDPNPLLKGQLRREVYRNLPGTQVLDLTRADVFQRGPAVIDSVTSLESTGLGTNYGVRLSGFLTPLVSGEFRFFLSSDDQSELWLSSDEQPLNRRRIAYEPQWSGIRDYTSTVRRTASKPENRSLPILLEAGRRYYLEVLHKQAGGGEGVAVAWQLPAVASPPANGSAPISGAFLSQRAFAPWFGSVPDDLSPYPGGRVTLAPQAFGSAPLDFQWLRDGQPISGATNASLVLSNLTVAASGGYTLRVRNEVGETNSAIVRVKVTRYTQTLTFDLPAEAVTGSNAIPLIGTSDAGMVVRFEVVSGPGRIVDGALVLDGLGPVVVRALQDGSDRVDPASVERTLLSVSADRQTIHLDPLPGLLRPDSAPVLLLGHASASSGLPVEWDVVSGPGRIDQGMLVILGSGRILLRVSQPGDASHAPAESVTQMIVVPPMAQPPTFGSGAELVLRFTVDATRRYRLERSEDLSRWTALHDLTPASGKLEVREPIESDSPGRFFRLVELDGSGQ